MNEFQFSQKYKQMHFALGLTLKCDGKSTGKERAEDDGDPHDFRFEFLLPESIRHVTEE